jgi:hypothetical protein
MISYEAYKVLHLVSVLTLFAVLGGVAVHAMNGGTLKGNAARRIVASMHGIALLVTLIAGFGLMSRLDLMRGGIPLWVWGKLVIWLATVLLLALPYRRPSLARPLLLFVLPLLGAAAAWLAVYKPGG